MVRRGELDASNNEFLAEIEDELNNTKKFNSNTIMPRVKLEKGESWLVRFIPVEIGANKSWYGRIAQHWKIGKIPYYCLAKTHKCLGGDDTYACPICEVAENLANHTNPHVAKVAEGAISNPVWVVYCIVYSKTKDGKTVETSDSDLCVLHKYTMFRSSFEELFAMFKTSVKKDNKLGLFDPKLGSDVRISRLTSGRYRLDKQDHMPITEDIDNIDQMMSDVMKTYIKLENEIKFSSDEEYLELADKLQELALNAENSSSQFSGRSRGRGNRQENLDVEEEQPIQRTSRSYAPDRNQVEPEQQERQPRSRLVERPTRQTIVEKEDDFVDEEEEVEVKPIVAPKRTQQKLESSRSSRIMRAPSMEDEEENIAEEEVDPAPAEEDSLDEYEDSAEDSAPVVPVTNTVNNKPMGASLDRETLLKSRLKAIAPRKAS